MTLVQAGFDAGAATYLESLRRGWELFGAEMGKLTEVLAPSSRR